MTSTGRKTESRPILRREIARQGGHRNPRLGRDHRGWPATGLHDAPRGRAGFRQDHLRAAVPRARRAGVRGAGNLRRLRGELEANPGERRGLRLEPAGAAAQESALLHRRPTVGRPRPVGRLRPRRSAGGPGSPDSGKRGRSGSCSTPSTSFWRSCPTRRPKRREVYRLHEWLLERELTGLITVQTDGDETRSLSAAAVRLHAVHGGLRGDSSTTASSGACRSAACACRSTAAPASTRTKRRS